MNAIANTIDTYLSAWNEPEATRRAEPHHNQLRFAWELVSPAATVTLVGLDVAAIDDDGRLLHVTGFFGPLPALETT